MNKDQWTEEVMNSLQGMTRAQAPAGLRAKIMDRMETSVRSIALRSPVKQWAAAAILLLAVNIGSVVYYTLQHKNKQVSTENGFGLQLLTESTYNY